jgi:hypothetical protein
MFGSKGVPTDQPLAAEALQLVLEELEHHLDALADGLRVGAVCRVLEARSRLSNTGSSSRSTILAPFLAYSPRLACERLR